MRDTPAQLCYASRTSSLADVVVARSDMAQCKWGRWEKEHMDPTARQHAGTEVEWLRKRARQLELENRELRRELDELRRGVGISVLIQGRLVPLSALPSAGAALPSYPTPAPFTATGQQSAAATFTPPPTWSEPPAQLAPPPLPYPPPPRRAPQPPPRGAT